MPGDSPGFAAAIGALYGSSYTLKFMSKKRAENPIDYDGHGLGGLVDHPGGRRRLRDVRPVAVDAHDHAARPHHPGHVRGGRASSCARSTPRRRGTRGLLDRLRLERFEEGLCVQVMHIGPYADEPATLVRMGEFAGQNGYAFHGPPPRDLPRRSAYGQAGEPQDRAAPPEPVVRLRGEARDGRRAAAGAIAAARRCDRRASAPDRRRAAPDRAWRPGGAGRALRGVAAALLARPRCSPSSSGWQRPPVPTPRSRPGTAGSPTRSSPGARRGAASSSGR